MARKVPIRYYSEDAVKKALKIDSFRNLSKDKVMEFASEFASMLPYVDKEVAISIIRQFPNLADFGKVLISYYMGMCDNILAKGNESQLAAINGYQTILDTLSRRMNEENISEEEAKSITEDMVTVADKIAEINLKYQKFLDRMGNKVLLGVGIVLAAVAAGLGISSKAKGNGLPALPNVSDDDDSDDNDSDDDDYVSY